ncbi:MAG: glycosyltransferase [Clostridia bacterium]|nr:glycosyltransferase [Clostridia bacterium]
MKVLQVNCVYNKGSTGKITYDIHAGLLSEGIESVICYGRGDKTKDANVYKTCGELYSKANNLLSRFTGVMYGGCTFSTSKLISIIKKEKPDIVHLQCINGYFVNIYSLIEWLKDNRIKTILTLHAEFMHTANCGHALDCEKWKTGCGNCPRLKKETKSLWLDGTAKSWKKMKAAFDGFKDLTVVSVSPWLLERASASPILAGKNHKVILNGLDDSIFRLRKADNLRNIYAPNGEKIIFHATPSFNDDPGHIKGGCFILEMAKRLADKNIKFVVAGRHSEQLKVPSNVTLLGNVREQDKLARLYSMADLTLIASKKETFSMIAAESLCCGTPIVGFKAGAPEQITIDEYSSFVEYGDIDALQNAVEHFLSIDVDKSKISTDGRAKYSKKRMVAEYIEVYKKAMKGEI